MSTDRKDQSSLSTTLATDDLSLLPILRVIMLILTATLGLLLIMQLLRGSMFAVGGLSAALGCMGVAAWIARRGNLRAASLFLAVMLLIIVTTLATLGRGIHNVLSVVYPTILIGFGLLLQRRDQILLAGLTVAAVGWLVFGELAGLYVPLRQDGSSLADFVVGTTVLLSAAAAVQLLTGSLRRSLAGARHEMAERKQAEAAARQQAERLKTVSELAIECAAAGPDVDLLALIAEKLRAMTDAMGVTISTYDPQARGLTVRYVATSGPVLARVNQLLGRNLIGMPLPLSEEMRQRMLGEVGTVAQSLTDVTFGSIPPPLAAVIQKTLGIAGFTGLALAYGDELIGSAMIVMRSGHEPLAPELAKVLAHVIAVSLRRQQAEERLRHEALHDLLTGLPNRTLFLDRLQHAIRRQQRLDREAFAVLFIDLDRFKTINDSLGHLIGDHLLVAVARRLESCLRPGDTVARLGGDEFTVLLEPLDHPQDVVAIAERIQQTLSAPFHLDEHEVFTSASTGIALGGAGYRQPDEVLRDADTAMYEAKLRGKACHVLFDHAMHADVLARLQLDTELRRALERQELRVFYQPVVALHSGQTVGLEALVRWQHPERGLLLPGAFLPLAEENGLIAAIDQWVLDAACRQLAGWQTRLPNLPPLTISVNLSPRQLARPDLVEQIARILRETGLAPGQLALEIVESALIGAADVGSTPGRLHTLGVRLSIDDFGTGYSALSYLHQLPIRTIKIDRSFVVRLGGDQQSQVIITAIIAMAHALGMDVVAEGMETAAQRELLLRLGCGYGQGWLFAPPLDDEAAEAFIVAFGQPECPEAA